MEPAVSYFGEIISGSETSEKWSFCERQAGRFAGGENTVSNAAKRPKIRFANGNPPGFYFGEIISGFEISENMVISRTVSPWFRRQCEYVFSGSETSKNGHLTNWNTAVSYFRRKFFRCWNVDRNYNFVNGKPAVWPDARISFQAAKRPKIVTLRKGTRPFLISGGNFSGAKTS